MIGWLRQADPRIENRTMGLFDPKATSWELAQFRREVKTELKRQDEAAKTRHAEILRNLKEIRTLMTEATDAFQAAAAELSATIDSQTTIWANALAAAQASVAELLNRIAQMESSDAADDLQQLAAQAASHAAVVNDLIVKLRNAGQTPETPVDPEPLPDPVPTEPGDVEPPAEPDPAPPTDPSGPTPEGGVVDETAGPGTQVDQRNET